MKFGIAISAALFAVAGVTATASAETITFDEFAYDNSNGTIPADEYAALGVTFMGTDDGSTWGGNSNGDPGNWDLEGTNGAGFSGYNGQSDGMTLLFAGDITNFSMDTARSNGSSDGDSITLEGWLNGVLQETVSVFFGNINEWATLSITGVFDEVRWVGAGSGFNPFGVDNINYTFADGQVPIPAALPIFLSGLAALGFRSRRRKQAK